MSEIADRPAVEVAPLESRGALVGFLLIGRWPEDTVEWAKLLVLAVRLAAVPGLLPESRVYRVLDDVPDSPHPGAVGMIMGVGRMMGDGALAPGQLANPQPHGLLALHPPSSTIASVPGYHTASGCVFLPGLPHLGLDHRAAWAEADVDGTVTHLVSKADVDPFGNADTAVLASLLAA